MTALSANNDSQIESLSIALEEWYRVIIDIDNDKIKGDSLVTILASWKDDIAQGIYYDSQRMHWKVEDIVKKGTDELLDMVTMMMNRQQLEVAVSELRTYSENGISCFAVGR